MSIFSVAACAHSGERGPSQLLRISNIIIVMKTSGAISCEDIYQAVSVDCSADMRLINSFNQNKVDQYLVLRAIQGEFEEGELVQLNSGIDIPSGADLLAGKYLIFSDESNGSDILVNPCETLELSDRDLVELFDGRGSFKMWFKENSHRVKCRSLTIKRE